MAGDYFLKIDGIDGESTDKSHKGEIDLVSWSWGESNSGTLAAGVGGSAGIVAMQDFHFVMQFSKASPKLMLACATGEHLREATLVCRKAGSDPHEYLKVKVSDLLISSYQTAGSPGDLMPVDQISRSFSKIEFEYRPQKADGTLDQPVKTGYDLKKNAKF